MSDFKLPPELPGEEVGKSVKKRDPGMECLLGNVALPGFGTWSSGSRKTGLAQILFALLGFVLTNAFAVWFAKYWMRTGKNPAEVMTDFYVQTGQWPADETRWVLIGLTGIGVFVLTFLWGMLFAVLLRRRLRD
jgi:hypothetical protein